MYLWDLIFFTAGIFILLRKREGHWWIVPMWLILGIIPAGTARETPHALRIEATLPTFQIFTAIGVTTFLYWMKSLAIKKYFKFSIIFAIFFILFLNFLYFYHDYTKHYAKQFSREWQYGYRESIDYVAKNYNNYDEIRVMTALGRPYIYYLFYTKYNPDHFRQTAVVHRDANGFVNVLAYDKLRFIEKMNTANKSRRKILYISTPDNIPKKSIKLKTFYILNGEPILVAFTRKI